MKGILFVHIPLKNNTTVVLDAFILKKMIMSNSFIGLKSMTFNFMLVLIMVSVFKKTNFLILEKKMPI